MRIPFLRACFTEEASTAISSVLESGYVGTGTDVERFEGAIQAYLGSGDVVCTSSCTGALSLAYEELLIKEGSKVLSTPMTCAATNIPLLHLGARVVWLDVDPLSGNVTPAALSAALEEHPDAVAAIIVDWAGMPCDYDGIREVSTHRVPVVLDAAQSFGSTHRGRTLPAVGDFICYSFGPTKILSSIEGGAFVTSSTDVAERMRSSRWYGIDRCRRSALSFWDYDIEHAGHRLTMNNVCAAAGLSMLKQFHIRLALHRRLAEIYRSGLAGIPGVHLCPIEENCNPNYWMFSAVFDQRASLMRKLHAVGIHAATPHNRNDRLSCFATKFPPQDLPGTAAFSESYVCLPIGPWVTEEDCEAICAAIRSGW